MMTVRTNCTVTVMRPRTMNCSLRQLPANKWKKPHSYKCSYGGPHVHFRCLGKRARLLLFLLAGCIMMVQVISWVIDYVEPAGDICEELANGDANQKPERI
jgi:hypothetical protein